MRGAGVPVGIPKESSPGETETDVTGSGSGAANVCGEPKPGNRNVTVKPTIRQTIRFREFIEHPLGIDKHFRRKRSGAPPARHLKFGHRVVGGRLRSTQRKFYKSRTDHDCTTSALPRRAQVAGGPISLTASRDANKMTDYYSDVLPPRGVLRHSGRMNRSRRKQRMRFARDFGKQTILRAMLTISSISTSGIGQRRGIGFWPSSVKCPENLSQRKCSRERQTHWSSGGSLSWTPGIVY